MFRKFLPLLIFGLILLMGFVTPPVFANTIGVSFSDSTVDGLDVGVIGDYETQLHEYVKIGAEGQFQRGDLYLGNADVAVTFGDERLGVRLETTNNFKGDTLEDIGRTNALGVGLVFPIFGLEVSGSIFGKTGNPFKPTFQLSDPTDPNSDVEEKDAGIRMKPEATLNLALKTEWDWKRLEIALRGLFEIAGEGDRYHQLDVGLETGGKLTDSLNWTLQGKLIGQLIDQEDGAKIYSERTLIGGITYNF